MFQVRAKAENYRRSLRLDPTPNGVPSRITWQKYSRKISVLYNFQLSNF
jgi:hypothetical protein